MQPRQRQQQQSFWDKVWRDRSGEVVIAQKPSWWLFAWIAFAFISFLAPSDRSESILWTLSLIFLAIWAIQEVLSGANYFRRSLGVLTLLFGALAVFAIGW